MKWMQLQQLAGLITQVLDILHRGYHALRRPVPPEEEVSVQPEDPKKNIEPKGGA